MKIKKYILIISIISAVCFIIFFINFSYSSFNEKSDVFTNQINIEDNVIKLPLNINALNNIIGLINGTIIYQTIDQSSTTFHKYSIKDDSIIDCDAITNFILNGKRTALIDSNLYFYVTVLTEKNTLEDCLYCIDMNTGKQVQLSADEKAVHIIPVSSWRDNVVSLFTEVDEESNLGQTKIVMYNPVTRGSEDIIVKSVDYKNSIGEVIINFTVANNQIYILKEIGKSDGVKTVIDVYNTDYKLINVINLDNIKNILNQPISDFATYHTDTNYIKEYIFYKRGSNKYYILNKNGLLPFSLKIDSSSTIRCMFADRNGVLAILYDATKDEKIRNQSFYYLRYEYLTSK